VPPTRALTPTEHSHQYQHTRSSDSASQPKQNSYSNGIGKQYSGASYGQSKIENNSHNLSDHEADDPALEGFVTLQKERLQSLTRLQQNYKKDSASRKTESYYMKRLQQIESLHSAFETSHQVILCIEGYAKTNYHAKKLAVSSEDMYMETYCLVAEGQRIKPISY